MVKVLVISAHPDDETLGCGGTLLKHQHAGDKIHWAIVTSALGEYWTDCERRVKSDEIEVVSKRYNFKSYHRLNLPSTELDVVPFNEIIDGIRKVIEETKPEVVYVVSEGDIHSDHRLVFQASMSVLKPIYMTQLGISRVLSFETLSSTEASATVNTTSKFVPNCFNDISDFLEDKISMMSVYQSELHKDPLPRGPSAIRSLARYRGATCGFEYAEAFMMIREITL